MATTKRSGSRRASQRPPEVPASESIQPFSKYTQIFEATFNLNRAFDEVLQEVARLKRMGFFSGDVSNRIPRTCRLMLEELRGWAMSDMTIEIHETANSHPAGEMLGKLAALADEVGRDDLRAVFTNAFWRELNEEIERRLQISVPRIHAHYKTLLWLTLNGGQRCQDRIDACLRAEVAHVIKERKRDLNREERESLGPLVEGLKGEA